MKKITYFWLSDCPYCKQANKAINELKNENEKYADIEIDRIEETEYPNIIEKYDYHAVPCMWVGEKKIYESHLFESYKECKQHVKEVFEYAIS